MTRSNSQESNFMRLMVTLPSACANSLPSVFVAQHASGSAQLAVIRQRPDAHDLGQQRVHLDVVKLRDLEMLFERGAVRDEEGAHQRIVVVITVLSEHGMFGLRDLGGRDGHPAGVSDTLDQRNARV